MDKIQFKCPCGKVLAVDPRHAGKLAKCPACQRATRVPAAPQAPPQPEHVAPKQDMARDITSLSELYSKAAKDKSRQMKVDAMVREQRRKALRWQIPVAAVILLILGLFVFNAIFNKKVGPEISDPEKYSITIQAFLPDLNNKDPYARGAATYEIGDLLGLEPFTLVSIMSSDPSPDVRLIAIQKLHKMAMQNNLKVTDSIEKMLNDSSIDVRMTAAFALAKIKEGSISPTAVRKYVSQVIPIPELQSWHKQATAENAVKENILPKIRDLMKSEDADIRALSAWLAVSTAGPVSDMATLLKDTNPMVVASAIRALTPFLTAEEIESLDPTFTEPLRDRLNLLTSIALCLQQKSPEVRSSAAMAISGSACNETARMLGTGLNSDDWFVRYMMLKGLLHVSPKVAREISRQTPEPGGFSKNELISRLRQKIEETAMKSVDDEEDETYETESQENSQE